MNQLRIGTGCITILLLACLLGSCASSDGSAMSKPPVIKQCRFMGLSCAPDCSRFYNNGHHIEWAECMGVGYVRQ